jgi:hypothetical protein
MMMLPGRAGVASFERFTGIFRKLTQEHGELIGMLLRLRMTSSIELRARLFPIVREELLAHERGELDVLYAALQRYEELRWSGLQHRREALKLERLVERVSGIAYDDESWGYAFAHLADTVQQHAAEEEDELFPTAQRILGMQTAQVLRTRYELTKLPTSH